ncbi:Transcriptional regulatory protein SIN3 [Nakaseomyces bracarensis]|uniref:Transcriptional regulatory protein SIN3 n=1 Tax=Nakaseomyces bracarensis TaxID=273131 RepID=A0ABR4NQ66_9SACH
MEQQFVSATDAIIKHYYTIKEQLSPTEYGEFREIIRSYDSGSGDLETAILKVNELIQLHPKLQTSCTVLFPRKVTHDAGTVGIDGIVAKLFSKLDKATIRNVEEILRSVLSFSGMRVALEKLLKGKGDVLKDVLSCIPDDIEVKQEFEECIMESNLRSTIQDTECTDEKDKMENLISMNCLQRNDNVIDFLEYLRVEISDDSIYSEFLKLLNVFSQGFLSIDEFSDRASHFFGPKKHLYERFKRVINYKPVKAPLPDKDIPIQDVENIKDFSSQSGPSYKRLSEFERSSYCCGRDKLCNEVLNDEWVGHPVWASEEVGFIAHKKNQYEENLFKVEEERHEYDSFLLSTENVISKLENLESRLPGQTGSVRRTRVAKNINRNIEIDSIMKKVLKRIYGLESSESLLEALKTNPQVVVPTLLKTLRAKYKEWKIAQNEWNKAWRELEQKVYYKSLDHQGLIFKNAEKRFLTTKHIISEYTAEKVDRNKTFKPDNNFQFGFSFKDKDLLNDIKDLIICGIKSNSSSTDLNKNSYLGFFEKYFTAVFGKFLGEESYDIKFSEVEPNTSISQLSREDLSFMGADNDFGQNKFLGASLANKSLHEMVLHSTRPNFFCDTNVYFLFHYIKTLYERFEEIKEINISTLNAIRQNKRRPSVLASRLGLLPTQLKDSGLELDGQDAFKWLKNISKRLLIGSIDHQWFEESLRINFENRAYKLYTIDRVIQSIQKSISHILKSPNLLQILDLYVSNLRLGYTSKLDQLIYRTQTRLLLGSDMEMFRLEISSQEICIYAQYIGQDDLIDISGNSESVNSRVYAELYFSPEPTPEVDRTMVNTPYYSLNLLKREEENLLSAPETNTETYLELKVNPEDCSLEVEPGSVDICSLQVLSPQPASRQTLKREIKFALDQVFKRRKP